ncbi:MAG: ammonium transporter [Eubacteriales bacterium]|nr:ammonium transporter [Eubacteriales bacterium]
MYSSVNTIWVLLGAAMVFFMQAGFAMCEAGFTRAKNSGNILMKNLMDFSIGTPVFWLVGFGLMFGSTNSIFGWFDPMVRGDYSAVTPEGVPFMAFLIFQTVFCATAATIVSGSMAERTKFSAYCLYSLCISLFIYPISGHWIWGGGWLSELGFHDFAGSTCVHMVGGVCALIGASILGPRIGKYGKDGKVRAIPGHNLPLAALGVFILWFAWFGFNGCSTVSMEGDAIASAASVFVTTNMCPAVACVTCMIFTWIRYKKPDVSMTYNAALAGLVGITAGCDMVSPLGAAIMGIIMGIAVVLSIEFFDQKLKIDDPVGAISVHGVCGALGTICVGLFATDSGLFYGGGAHFFLVQLLGVVVVAVYVAVVMFIVFTIINKTVGLRVSVEEELAGMDSSEHNLPTSYADFVPMPVNKSGVAQVIAPEEVSKEAISAQVPIAEAIPVTKRTIDDGDNPKLTKVVVITKPSRLDKLKEALEDIGIAGITVTNVLGCGVEKGKPEYYRGAAIDMTLRPKIKMEMVVSRIPVDTVVDTCRQTLYTGHIGDGKIFVSDIEDVIKVRTGATGYDALQDED